MEKEISMCGLRDMIDAIAGDDFDGARASLKSSLAEYMAGKRYISNRDVFGDRYNNPNDDEQTIKAGLAESDKEFEIA